MGARYYDPTIGRFITPDPIDASVSAYTFASGNPIMFFDPSGLASAEPTDPRPTFKVPMEPMARDLFLRELVAPKRGRTSRFDGWSSSPLKIVVTKAMRRANGQYLARKSAIALSNYLAAKYAANHTWAMGEGTPGGPFAATFEQRTGEMFAFNRAIAAIVGDLLGAGRDAPANVTIVFNNSGIHAKLTEELALTPPAAGSSTVPSAEAVAEGKQSSKGGIDATFASANRGKQYSRDTDAQDRGKADGSSDEDNWGNNVMVAVAMTLGWISGKLPAVIVFVDDDVANSFRNAHGIDEARSDYYSAGKLEGDKSFGLSGLAQAGIDPIEQFTGSYHYKIDVVDDNLRFTITNTTSFASLAYHMWPYSWNWTGGPMGNQSQVFIFTEPTRK